MPANIRVWVQMPNYSAAGAVIAKHIKAAGMTPSGFAKAAGISEGIIGPICRGTYHLPQYVSLELLDRIGHGLYPRDTLARQVFNQETLEACGFLSQQGDTAFAATVLRCADALNQVGRVAFARAKYRDRRKRLTPPRPPSRSRRRKSQVPHHEGLFVCGIGTFVLLTTYIHCGIIGSESRETKEQTMTHIISKDAVASTPNLWDDDSHPVYDPRAVEWWLADDKRTILCGDPDDPEVVCLLSDEEPMMVENRTNMDTDDLVTLVAMHIVLTHNRNPVRVSV